MALKCLYKFEIGLIPKRTMLEISTVLTIPRALWLAHNDASPVVVFAVVGDRHRPRRTKDAHGQGRKDAQGGGQELKQHRNTGQKS